jgi:2-(1,2-epoxy-1,2-dihydrophenyl)acetyl-CoA isomerase
MGYQTITCDVRPPIAELALNRPEAGNTFTAELLTELAQAATELATEREVRAVVLRGNGKHFCYGASVDMFCDYPQEQRPPLIRDLSTKLHLAITRLTRLEVPVLGVGHGVVVGGGLSLLAACDVVIAAESTRFRLAWTGIGITMDGGATWTLPRIIGLHRTLELVHTNRIFTAAEAHAWGLVNWLVPDDEVEARTQELAETLAAGPTRALGWCKRLIFEGMTQPLDTQLENEAVTIVESFRTADSDEGFRAFREHRPPKFRGE